ncbi:hypothetical protein AYI70_g427 [Smittium culicis]|uniref:Uncharacterized protein n=1 Tax=Smittium culicis TaxID=133412 RepID=A0A1R1YGV2_9FUNG|nr:hypothetical protein AYI70_g427 [Smittium culicis]
MSQKNSHSEFEKNDSNKKKNKNKKGIFNPQNLFKSKNTAIKLKTPISQEFDDTLAISRQSGASSINTEKNKSKTRSSLFENISKDDYILSDSSNDGTSFIPIKEKSATEVSSRHKIVDSFERPKNTTKAHNKNGISSNKNKGDSNKNSLSSVKSRNSSKKNLDEEKYKTKKSRNSPINSQSSKRSDRFTNRRSQTVFNDLGIGSDRKKSLWDTINSKFKIRKNSELKGGSDLDSNNIASDFNENNGNDIESISNKYSPIVFGVPSKYKNLQRSKTIAEKNNYNDARDLEPKKQEPYQINVNGKSISEKSNDQQDNEVQIISPRNKSNISKKDNISENSNIQQANEIQIISPKNKSNIRKRDNISEKSNIQQANEIQIISPKNKSNISKRDDISEKSITEIVKKMEPHNKKRFSIEGVPELSSSGISSSSDDSRSSSDNLLSGLSDIEIDSKEYRNINYDSSIFRNSIDSTNQRISLIHPLLLDGKNVIDGKYDESAENFHSEDNEITKPRKSYSPNKKPVLTLGSNLSEQMLHSKIEESFGNLVMKTANDGSLAVKTTMSQDRYPYADGNLNNSQMTQINNPMYSAVSDRNSTNFIKSLFETYYLKRLSSIITSFILTFLAFLCLELVLTLALLPQKSAIETILKTKFIEKDLKMNNLPINYQNIYQALVGFVVNGVDIGKISQTGIVTRCLAIIAFSVFAPISGYYSKNAGFRESAVFGVIFSSIGVFVAAKKLQKAYFINGLDVFLCSIGAAFIVVPCTTSFLGFVNENLDNKLNSSNYLSFNSNNPSRYSSNASLYSQNILQIKRTSHHMKNKVDNKLSNSDSDNQNVNKTHAILIAIFVMIVFLSLFVSKYILIRVALRGQLRMYSIVLGSFFLVFGIFGSIFMIFEAKKVESKINKDPKKRNKRKSNAISFNLKTVKGSAYKETVETLKNLENRSSLIFKPSSTGPQIKIDEINESFNKSRSTLASQNKKENKFVSFIKSQVLSLKFLGNKKTTEYSMRYRENILPLSVLIIANLGILIPYLYFPAIY